MSRPAEFLPTYSVVLADDTSGALTLAETDIGTTFKTTARELACGQIPSGFVLSRVLRIDLASGLSTDVTRSVLLAAMGVCTDENWEPSPKLDAALIAYRVKAPVIAEPVTNAAHPADIARAESALIERAHDRGAAVSQISEAA